MLSSQLNPAAIPAIIADNFCTQLLSIQNALFARPAAEQIPTQQEINMQTKLLNNVIKIRKFNANDHVAKFMATFCRFLGKEDKELSKAVAEKYMQFMGLDITETEIEPTPPLKQAMPEPEPLPADTINLEERPYDYFDKYKHLLEDYRYGNKDSVVDIGEKQYNKQCVEYNLLQYTLPEADRRFIPDPGDYHTQIDHEQTIKQIERYLRSRAA